MSNISLEEARRSFYSTRELLKEVHSQEELNIVRTKLYKTRKVLLKIDPEFRAVVSENEQRVKKMKAESRQGIDTTAENAVTRLANIESEVLTQLRKTDITAIKWVQEHRLKIMTAEEAEIKSKVELICPICYSSDCGNIINGKPACIKCMHVLVPKETLGNYNRAYKRRWKKKRS